MHKTPKGNRLHIGIFGRRNVGKSALLNALTQQEVSIVSEVAGTTTDPVEKPMELLPLGPVLFIDTAGVDDEGFLGSLRIERTQQIFNRVDIGIVVTDQPTLGTYEIQLLDELRQRQIATIMVFNKIDQYQPDSSTLQNLSQQQIPYVETSAADHQGVIDLKSALIAAVPADFINTPPIVRDMLQQEDLVILVIPIDKEAPKGRLILPEAQTIRDILDGQASCLVTQVAGLPRALKRLKTPPKMVITDSQAFAEVAAATPKNVLLTSFSILFARQKGDLREYVLGAQAISRLESGDKILIAEACTHHPIADDIGRVKIPRWLQQFTGKQLVIDHCQGHDFPTNLKEYQLVIQCGACMLNRREVLSRIYQCKRMGVPITNYGIAIAYTLGIFERALQPFPEVAELTKQ
jgi:[FeFe] hydrogenase H-cluster maturation GTPase HydF